MQTLKNQSLTIKINPKGAELISVFNEETQTEYMWSADANFWGKSSPVLFPIVGALKDNLYYFEGKPIICPVMDSPVSVSFWLKIVRMKA